MDNGHIWADALQPTSAQFVQDIVDQIPELGRDAFESILDVLTKHISEDNQKALDKLAALEAGGVDNWEWYDDCIDTLRDDEEDEDD